MNFKKLFLSAVVGLSMMAFAGTASAGYITSDINIYGASAQFNFWKANGTGYMSANNCTNFEYGYYADAKKDFIIKGTCTQEDASTKTIFMRISSKASYDGILAVTGDSSTFASRVKSCDVTGDPTSYFKRKMIDDTTCSPWGTYAAPAACSGTICTTVTVGASDTACKCFTQKTKGCPTGPTPATCSQVTTDMTGINCPGDANVCKPMIVPFSFFVNNLVTKGGVQVTNISYDNLQLIFTGQVSDWSQIYDYDGVAYDAKALVACQRHAGSGTQASVNAYLMASPNCSKDNFLKWQQATDKMYFNDGSSTMMACVKGVDHSAGTGNIGYADSDQSLSSYPGVTRITVGGVPTPLSFANIKTALINGEYNFYGVQHLYGVLDTDPLCAYIGGGVSEPMATASQMKYDRNNTCCSWAQTKKP